MPGPVLTQQQKGKSAGRMQGRAPRPDERYRPADPQRAGNQAAAQSQLDGELQRDIKRIKDELDSFVYTAGVEERVIAILYHWAGRGSMASGYLDWIFDSLQATRKGLFSDTTYYDAMFDNFDRVDEIRMIRDGTMRYRGRESSRETRRQAKEAQRQAEEKARREETDLEADLAGKWTENKAEPYEIPATPMNIFAAKLEIRRLEEKQAGQLLPVEKKVCDILSKLPPQEKPLVLLKKVHFITESERIERRKAQMREIIHPLLEMLLWATAERILVFGVEAILARLFAAEARTAVALAPVKGKAAVGMPARRGAARGGSLPGGDRIFTGPGFEYQIKSIDPVTGEAVAMGRSTATGEIVTLRMNIDTGAGLATRTNGKTLPIRGGRIETPKPALPSGQAGLAKVPADIDAAVEKSFGEWGGAGKSAGTRPLRPSRPAASTRSAAKTEKKPVSPVPGPERLRAAETKALPSGGKELPPPAKPLTQRDLMALFVKQYKVPVPSLEFYQGYRTFAEYEAAFLRRSPGYKGPVPRGWFDPLTKLIHFPPGANVHTMIHETLHWYGAKNRVGMNLGSFMNEGLTDWLVRKQLGERSGKHAYDAHVRFVRELAGHVGEEPMMMAFLHGRWDYFHRAMYKQAGSLNNAQRAYFLLARISADGKGMEYMAEVRRLLRMKAAKPIPKGPKPPGKPKPGTPSKKPATLSTKPAKVHEADFLPAKTNFIPYEVCQEDKSYVQNLMATVLKELSPKTRFTIKRNKTIAITLVQDIDDGHLHLVWTGSRNFGNKEIETVMARHGVTRWNTANPGVKGRGEVGAPQDAEQLMAELFDPEDPDFIPLLIVTSRQCCADCSILLKKLKVSMVNPPQW